MAQILRILQLTPRFPFPPDDGGKIGMANITKEFARNNCDVTLFSLSDFELSDETIMEAKKYCKPIIVKHNTKNTKSRIVKTFLTNKPLFITKHNNKLIRQKLKELVSNNEFDIIHCDHSSMAPLGLYLKSLTGLPVGLRLHNIEWLIWQRYSDVLGKLNPLKIYLNQQALLLKKAEKDLYSKVDVCFAITDYDLIRAKELSQYANVVVASAGVDFEEWKTDATIQRNPHELILATVYDWVHNVDGIKWFLRNVYDTIKSAVPDVSLTLLGKYPPAWLLNYPDKSVNCLGYVPSVKPYLNKAAIYISPLFVGAGIRIKILEAMAMKLPVVATPVAAEGIKCDKSEGLIIASDENQFAQAIINLCNYELESRILGENAFNFVKKNFSWEKNVGIMVDEYQKLASK